MNAEASGWDHRWAEEVQAYLRRKYRNIFDEKDIQHHFEEYAQAIKPTIFQQINRIVGLRPGLRLLDMGCGFGSFVLACRQAGVDAVGLDIEPQEVEFARQRLVHEEPDCDPMSVYIIGDAHATHFPAASFDVITAWNVLEHVDSYERVVKEAFRLLKPQGRFIGIAPNYSAFRREAHYQVPWLPHLPRRIASVYLRRLGRDPRLLEDIHYVTNWSILRTLRRTGFSLWDPALAILSDSQYIVSPRRRKAVAVAQKMHLGPWLQIVIKIHQWSPFKNSVYFAGDKRVKR